MSTSNRKKNSNTGFREYCCRNASASVDDPVKDAYVATVTDGIINLIAMALDRVKKVSNFLHSAQTEAHLLSGHALPKSARTKVEEIQHKIESAFVCYSSGVQRTVEDPNLFHCMTSITDQSQHLYSSIDETSVFARKKNPAQSLQRLRTRLKQLEAGLNQAHLALIPYAHRAAVTEVPAPHFSVTPSIQKTVKAADPAYTEKMRPFLEQLRSKGWKAPEPEPVATFSPLFGDDDETVDDFDRGAVLIQRVRRPTTELLQEEEIVGIVKFPVISYNTKRLPESLIHKCTDHRVGYSIYLVFGGYMVVENMFLLGIHKSLMWVDGEQGVEVDIDKFMHLLPYVREHQPQWAGLLKTLHPIQPARLSGSHFYCPLLPVDFLNRWGNGIGNWALLNS